jgi:uncharacterized protein
MTFAGKNASHRGVFCRILLTTLGFLLPTFLAPSAQAQDLGQFLRLMQGATQPQQRPQGAAPRASSGQGFDPEVVREVQQMLNALGYQAGPANGNYGSASRQAMQRFQTDNGLPATGMPDIASMSRLRSNWQAAGSPPPAASGGSPATTGQARPSFDCRRANTPAMQAVCASDTLSRLDAAMGESYGAYMTSVSPALAAAQKARQRQWLQSRERCGADVNCIQALYQSRLAQLGAPDPLRGMPAQQADGASGGQQSAIPVVTATGLAPLDMPTLNGMPIVTEKSNVFFQLVALRAQPAMLDDRVTRGDVALAMAQSMLTPDAKNQFLRYSQWAGQDEFTKDDTRKRFLDEYGHALTSMAPKPPFRFVYSLPLYLGEYDSERGGFPIQGLSAGGARMAFPQLAWLQPVLRAEWPDDIWKLSKDKARAQLQSLAQAQVEGGSQPGSRSVAAVLVVEATAIDPDTLAMTLDVKSLSLYDPGLRTKLTDLAFKQEQASPVDTDHLSAAKAALSKLDTNARDNLLAEAKKISSTCDQQSSSFVATHDCSCVTDRFVLGRIDKGPDAYVQQIFEKAAPLCLRTDEELARYAFKRCQGQSSSEGRGTRDLACYCYGERYAAAYKVNPLADPDRIDGGIRGVCDKLVEAGTFAEPNGFDELVKDWGAPHPGGARKRQPSVLDGLEQAAPAAPAVIMVDDTWIQLQFVDVSPSVLPDDRLADGLTYTINNEQRRWADIDQFLAKQQKGGQNGIDPAHPAFLFDWQTESQKRPDFANTTLVDLFLNRSQDWSFAEKEPGFDPRYDHAIEIFLFPKQAVASRQAAFAARELLPTFRRFLSAARARLPTEVGIEVQLPDGAYNFEDKALEFSANGAPVELLSPQALGKSTPMADGMAIYSAGNAAAHRDWDAKSPSPYWIRQQGGSPFEWRTALASAERLQPMLALDRRLLLPPLPLSTADAEKATAAASAGGGYRALLIVRARSSAIAQVRESDGAATGVIAVELVRVDVTTRNGTLIASLPAESFPLERESASQEQNAAQQAGDAAGKAAEAEKAKQAQAAADRDQAAKDAAAKAQADLIAKAARPDGPFGPELAGLRLGMPLAQAETEIRKRFKVAAVIDPAPSVAGYAPTLLGRRTYLTENGADMITVFSLPEAGDRVVGIARRIALPLPPPSMSDARDTLIDKYRQPTAAYGDRFLYWTDNPEGLGSESSACRVIANQSTHAGYTFTEGRINSIRSTGGADGSLEAYALAGKAMATLRGLEAPDASLIEPLRACPTTLWADVELRERDPYMLMAVTDGGWIAETIRKTREAAGAETKNVMKKLLDAN